MKRILFIGALIGLITASCSYTNPKFIDEGLIDYDAKVINVDHPMASLAPGKMTVKFKKELFASEMSVMGVFTTTFISNPIKKNLTVLVKMFDVKQACIDDEKAIKAECDAYKLEFEETKETKVIAGYKCKKVIVTMSDDPTIKYDVYYTEELNVTNPNFSNPYNKINGMLMQFRLKKFGLEMEFTAQGVTKEDVPDETFELPAYYKVITKAEMDEVFKSIQ